MFIRGSMICVVMLSISLIATHYLALMLSCSEQNSAKIGGLHSEANGMEPAIDFWIDTYPFLMTVRTFAAYLSPFFKSTLKIIFHLINGITQHDIFTSRFHREICKGLLYTMALERERERDREVEKVCQYSQFWLNGSA